MTQIRARISRHEKAEENQIEQGIRLLDLTQHATEIFLQKGREERRELVKFVMPNSLLDGSTIRPVYKSPFDIIHQLADDARKVSVDEKTAVPSETARLVLLPRVDSNS